MELRKLSFNVNQKTNTFIRRIILGLCLLAGIAVLGTILSSTVKDNGKQVRLYSAQIDNSMSEKISFIDTVAAGVSSGSVTEDYHNYVDTMVELYDDVSAVYVCIEEEGVVYSDGIMTYMSGGWVPDDDFVVSNRSWYQGAMATDSVYVSEPYVDEQSGNICITLSKAVYKDGKAVGVAGMDMYMDDLVSLIESSYDGGNYVFLVSTEGTILTHPDDDIALTVDSASTVSDAYKGKYESVCKENRKTKLIWDYNGGFKFAISNLADTTGWKVVAVISLTKVILIVLLIIVLVVVLGVVIGRWVKSYLTKGISPMFTPLEELALSLIHI